MTATKDERLQEVGASALASIREMVAALECDYERRDELRDERDGYDEHDDQCGQSGNWSLDNPDELNDGEPSRAWLEVQDWGTPWTDYYEKGVGDLCLAYASCFYFGE